jgi:hypothetical protein
VRKSSVNDAAAAGSDDRDGLGAAGALSGDEAAYAGAGRPSKAVPRPPARPDRSTLLPSDSISSTASAPAAVAAAGGLAASARQPRPSERSPPPPPPRERERARSRDDGRAAGPDIMSEGGESDSAHRTAAPFSSSTGTFGGASREGAPFPAGAGAGAGARGGSDRRLSVLGGGAGAGGGGTGGGLAVPIRTMRRRCECYDTVWLTRQSITRVLSLQLSLCWLAGHARAGCWGRGYDGRRPTWLHDLFRRYEWAV